MYLYPITRNLIFASTIIFASILLFVLVFPNYIISHTIEIVPQGFEKNKFSIWFLPLLISNAIFFTFLIGHKFGKLPNKITFITDTFQKKDISRNLTFFLISIIFVFYIIFSAGEFYSEEFEFGDYKGVITTAQNWETQFESSKITPALRYLFLFVSLEYLGNIRFLPYLASIGLLLLTYFITKEISGKRISGLISFVTLLQSNLFLMYDTTSTYENFWVFFYLLSLYMMIKNSSTSSLSFVVTLFLKPLTVIFLPVNIFWIIMDQKIKNKKRILFGFSVIISLIIIALTTTNFVHVESVGFNIEQIVLSFNEIGNSLRFDILLLIILIPVIVLLYLQSKNYDSRKIYILFAIFISLISQSMLYGITDTTVQPYRFIPFVLFMSIGFGLVFSWDQTSNRIKSNM